MAEFKPSRNLKLNGFKTDISFAATTKLLFDQAAIPPSLIWDPYLIETLSIARMVGKGRTNLTLIRPDLVQSDAPTPYANFDLRTGPRAPVAQFHFRPDAYGITGVGDYVANFLVEAVGTATYGLSGFLGTGSFGNPGAKSVSGRRSIQVVIKNLPATQDGVVAITQTAGTQWAFYEVRISFPRLVFKKL